MKPSTTDTVAAAYHKTLLYSQHGWGKTTQAIHLKRAYGPGLILSAEGGLRSLMGHKIDYIAFDAWAATKGKVSFEECVAYVQSDPDFKKRGYKWLMLDSATELADLCYGYFDEKHKGSRNNFAVWQDYASSYIGALKWFRDMPYHVLVTALAKDDTTDNGDVEWWPMIQGSRVQKQVPGVFDHVLGGVRIYEEVEEEVGGVKRKAGKTRRFIVTEKVKGFQGKVRDPLAVAPPIMETGDVTVLFNMMDGKKGGRPEATEEEAIVIEQQEKSE